MISNLSKILIFLFLTICVSISFFCFSFAQNENLVNEREIVFVCPDAKSLDEVYYGCPGMTILHLGETKNGMTLGITEYEGKEYYIIYGFENGGAGILKKEPKLETQIAIVEMIYDNLNILDEITKIVGDKKPPLLLSELSQAKIDLEDYTLNGKIEPGQTKKLKMKFKFLETAGNEYQGKSIKVRFKFKGIQER